MSKNSGPSRNSQHHWIRFAPKSLRWTVFRTSIEALLLSRCWYYGANTCVGMVLVLMHWMRGAWLSWWLSSISFTGVWHHFLVFSLFKACTPKQVLHHTHAVPDGGVGLHHHPYRLLCPHVLLPHQTGPFWPPAPPGGGGPRGSEGFRDWGSRFEVWCLVPSLT
jgi:hypothetical protein